MRSQTKVTEPRVALDGRAIDAKEVARLLSLSERTVRRLDQEGKLPRPVRIGGSVRWRLEEIQAWLHSGCPERGRWETRRN